MCVPFLSFCVSWLLLQGKEDKAMRVLRLIYKDKALSESYFNKIKLASNVLSLREQLRLVMQWRVLQRSVTRSV